jgi:uncharacterized protein (TIGR01244 family)
MKLRRLDERTWVAGQIAAADVGEIGAQGIISIVNNRPDGEEPGQPRGAQIEAAARAEGIDYRYIPIGSSFSNDQVEEMAGALRDAGGPLLAFCRSGTRSTFLWALARHRMLADVADLFEKAAAAGYDLAPIKGFLEDGD